MTFAFVSQGRQKCGGGSPIHSQWQTNAIIQTTLTLWFEFVQKSARLCVIVGELQLNSSEHERESDYRGRKTGARRSAPDNIKVRGLLVPLVSSPFASAQLVCGWQPKWRLFLHWQPGGMEAR